MALPDYTSLVNLLQGTASSPDLSTGNTLPLVARPFGMNHWTLQTDEVEGWFFRPTSPTLQALRLTHQPSPWMRDYAWLNLFAGPATGTPDIRSETRAQRAVFTALTPQALGVDLPDAGLTLRLAPTSRAAAFACTGTSGRPVRLFLETGGTSGLRLEGERVVGFTRFHSGGAPDTFAFHFVITFDAPIRAAQAFSAGNPTAEAAEVDAAGLALDFAADGITGWIGTSFIDAAQAERNLVTEVGRRPVDEISEAGREAWNSVLGRIDIDADDPVKRTFYSCLYRAHLFPREFHEVDAAGRTVHYSPFHGGMGDGPLSTDNGFWDTHRTVYSLLFLLDPMRGADIVNGYLTAADESGWLPQWASPGHRKCMPGTHSDPILAEAVAWGLPGVDPVRALAAMRKHATTPVPDEPGYGRPGLDAYLERGYVPEGFTRAATAATLDYAYDDFAIAEVARRVGDEKTAREFRERARNYRHVHDPAVGFLRGRAADGTFAPNFDEFAWGGAYCEGGAWQSTWSVPHDPAGLAELLGGPAECVRRLDAMFQLPGTFHVGGYGKVIHEMTEMARLPFGQYAHSNQPQHHVLHLYTALGYPWKTQHWVRRVLREAYSPDAFCGDEDNGEMASWYVLNALGIFPLCPGRGEFVLGAPLVRSARIQTATGATLHIVADGQAPDRPFAQALTWRGSSYDRLWIAARDLASGGELRFRMGAEPPPPPEEWRADQLPASLTPLRDHRPDPTLCSAP